jgi:PQQ-dependent dehydrogenase (methanol/ethanol family)
MVLFVFWYPVNTFAQENGSSAAGQVSAGRARFQGLCASCHGSDGEGGERGPSITGARRAALRSKEDLKNIIQHGIPEAGMPAFTLPGREIDELVSYLRSLLAPANATPVPGDPAAGERFFARKGKCSSCHAIGGRGGRSGPDLSDIGARRKLTEIRESIVSPSARITSGFEVVSVRLRNGSVARGFVKNESNYDIQLQGFDSKIYSLQRSEIASVTREKQSIMPATDASEPELRDLLSFLARLPEKAYAAGIAAAPYNNSDSGVPFSRIAEPGLGEWPSYDGFLSGNRHSPLTQINRDNVSKLGARWMYTVPNARLECTPVVIDGMMYVTHGNECHALDARTGRLVWRWSRAKTPGLVGDPVRGFNRGVAVIGDKVLMATDDGHLLALHRLNGGIAWEADMVGDVPVRNHYGATSAPLVAGDLVISGIAGGDGGIRGFLDAYRISDGKRAWRFWTIPRRGEPLSETWQGKALEYGCGSTWLTGTYDPQLDILYWTTGNPCPDYNGDERKGDNLYTSSVLALKPKTGKLVWYYQFTPHDLHDFDGQQTPMLIDAQYRGAMRKLLVQASRNGFFYVLDRRNGELLSATPYVRVTWAKGVGSDGKPVRVPGTEPSYAGVKVCPAPEGANNWMSNAYNAETGLFYVNALEKCSIYSKSVEWLIHGEQFYGGGARNVPDEPGQKFLRAISLETGKVAWEIPQIGPASSWGGLLSTAAGLVFFCDDSGAFATADARTGKMLWHFHTSQPWKASPMTYQIDDRQYVAVAVGSTIVSFGLAGNDGGE